MTVSLRAKIFFILLFTLLTVVPGSFARDASAGKDDIPTIHNTALAPYCLATHTVGKLVFGVTNFGRIGVGRGRAIFIDCFTGIRTPLGEYPRGSNTTYLYKGALWIGAVVGKDTLVSTGNDFNNESQEMHPLEEMVHRSTLDPESPEAQGAVSEQDFIAVYADTFVNGVPNPSFDPLEGRRHKPLYVKVTQRSYAWSYGHTDDFVIMEFDMQNIGTKLLRDVYVGIYWDGDVHYGQRSLIIAPDPNGGKGVTDGKDDLCGYLYSYPTQRGECTFLDTVGIAWTADNDGDPTPTGEFKVPNIVGIRFLNPILFSYPPSFNWWTFNYNPLFDYGPQQRKNYRYMGNGQGTPYGDRRKYALLSNGEVDFDQAYLLTIGQSDPVWMYPNQRMAYSVARGRDVQYLLSVGPFELQPGGSITLPIAVVGGEKFHRDRTNFNRHLSGHYQPDVYYDNVDFSDLVANANLADRVYDIPGVDTDDDGYRGEYRVCILDSVLIDSQWVVAEAETTYYRGDRVPDLVASEPPPAPEVWLTPIKNGLRVRFNGYRSETTRDIFSGKKDFEGYRIYLARDNRETSYSLVAQYDRKNYDKYVYVVKKGINPYFSRFDDPFTLEELRCLYSLADDPCADSSFDPLLYTPDRPYIHPQWEDSIFYFATHDYNESEWGVTTPIRKIYPNAPPPPRSGDLPPEYYTEDGYLKYYEYEFTIENLLPNVPYYVAVTAFDIGSPQTGLEPLESSKTYFSKYAYPNNELDENPDEVKNVYVFPNPYRNDAGYRQNGFEGLGQEDRSRDRVRKVTFANLPPKCTIRIFTLDGDLVREIHHDFSPADPNSSYHEWDLVSRNVQLVVSGLYYWVVEDENGNTQIGKLVIIL